VEHRQVQERYTTACRASGDDPARFLKELRQLRDGAGLGPAELAARAHYPYDRIRAAEAGPALPDLPVLSAYVRGCGGTTEEWEERWRSLTSAPTLPLLAARPAGSSTAADAGARIGSISPAADTPDPSIILAALDRVAEGMAVGEPTVEETSATVRESDQTAAEAGSATGEAGVAEGWVTEGWVSEGWVSEGWAAAPTPTVTPTVVVTPTAADSAPASTASARLSRTTILTAILVMICVLVAVLTIFA
jgi:hypothetical protein